MGQMNYWWIVSFSNIDSTVVNSVIPFIHLHKVQMIFLPVHSSQLNYVHHKSIFNLSVDNQLNYSHSIRLIHLFEQDSKLKM